MCCKGVLEDVLQDVLNYCVRRISCKYVHHRVWHVNMFPFFTWYALAKSTVPRLPVI